MASQWQSFKSKIPEFKEDSAYQEKVNDAKLFVLGTLSGENANIDRLAKLFSDRAAEKKKYEDAICDVNVELAALSQLLIEAYENEGIEKSTLASGATGYIGYIPYVKMIDEKLFYAWLHEQDMDGLRKINAMTLKSMVSEKALGDLRDGKEPQLPPGTDFQLGKQFRITK